MTFEALEAGSREYINLIEEATGLLESEKGRIGNLEIEGRLAKAKASGEAIVVGDLHGDLESLAYILKTSGFVEKAERNNEIRMVFLGDYGDRGCFSSEVYYTVMRLKQLFPQNVLLMRGNHEGPDDLQAHPHDMPQSLLERFGEDGNDVYAKLRGLYQHLYTAMIVEKSCVLLHGGIPKDARSLEDLAYAHIKHPKTTTFEEILWSDPVEDVRGTYPSLRGAGMLFGQDITQSFLDMCGVGILVRGHEPTPEGFRINHQGRVLTLFSRKGPPYFNGVAAYLQLDLSLRPQNAYELMPYIHEF